MTSNKQNASIKTEDRLALAYLIDGLSATLAFAIACGHFPAIKENTDKLLEQLDNIRKNSDLVDSSNSSQKITQNERKEPTELQSVQTEE